MTKERLSLQGLNHRSNTVVATNPEIVSLCDIVGEDYARLLADPGEHCQKHVSLQRLSLVNNYEGVVKRATANVGQWQHLENATIHNLLNDLLGDKSPESVENGLSPGVHLLPLGAWQVAKLLAANRIERPKDHDLLVLPAL